MRRPRERGSGLRSSKIGGFAHHEGSRGTGGARGLRGLGRQSLSKARRLRLGRGLAEVLVADDPVAPVHRVRHPPAKAIATVRLMGRRSMLRAAERWPRKGYEKGGADRGIPYLDSRFSGSCGASFCWTGGFGPLGISRSFPDSKRWRRAVVSSWTLARS